MQRKKVKKKSQNSRYQGFSYYICLMIEGSGSGSIPLTNGSGSGPKTFGSGGFGFGSGSATLQKRIFFILFFQVLRRWPSLALAPTQQGSVSVFFFYYSGSDSVRKNKKKNNLSPAVWGIRIRRIQVFLGLRDPDPLVRGTDPAPDPPLFS